MKTRATKLCGCLLISTAMVFGPLAQAAKIAGTLKEMRGRVLVNTGDRYHEAQGGMLLKLGDRILTLQGASATVVQNDGCVTPLAENMAFMLQTPSVCQGGVNSLRRVGPYYAQAIGGETKTDVPPQAPAEQPDPGQAIGAGSETDVTPQEGEAVTTAAGAPPPDEEQEEKKKSKKGYFALLALLLLFAGGGDDNAAVTHQ